MYIELAIVIIFILLLIIAIYKLKYQFWSKQPVFHIHNIKYWLFPVGIIQHKKPEKDKFFDTKQQFYELNTVGDRKKILFTTFIKSHYMPHKSEKYKPTMNNILSCEYIKETTIN